MATPAKIDVSPPTDPMEGGTDSALRSIPVDAIHPNPHQPRREFDEQSLESLAGSIRSAGVMQPIVVRALELGRYELVAGERRWRAARRAGLESIPAVIRTASDRESAEWSLVENLQREDLNPVERAEAFRRLIDEFGLRHQDVGELVGIDRSTVTNHLRILELDPQLQDLVRRRLLSLAHARALLAVAEPAQRLAIAVKAVREEWSLRAIEREIARLSGRTSSEPASVSAKFMTGRRAHLADLERRLSEHLGTRVQIRSGKKKGAGTMTIAFYDMQQFEGLLGHLGFDGDV